MSEKDGEIDCFPIYSSRLLAYLLPSPYLKTNGEKPTYSPISKHDHLAPPAYGMSNKPIDGWIERVSDGFSSSLPNPFIHNPYSPYLSQLSINGG